MRNTINKLFSAIIATVILMSFSFVSPLTTNAKEQTVSIVGRVYEFEEKSEYEVDSSKSTSTSENSQTLGQFSITGDISKEYTNKGFTAYEITDGTIISIQYKYDIRTAVSLGGDCDTLTCIAGGIAEAFYGVSNEVKDICLSKLPDDIVAVIKRFDDLRKDLQK